MAPDDSQRDTLRADGGARRRILRFESLKPGSVFAGRFEIVRTLGGGGSGEVFHARDRLLSQDVAIKVLFPGTSDRDVERLRREVRAARALQHPNILRVHDLGEHEGLFYIVSELLEGESLAQRLAGGGPLEPEEAEHFLRGILEALACAHAASIVHRDVKPANVFLAKTGVPGRPRVVLLDFGLARSIEGGTVTAPGAFVGTPEYCAPEQIRGERDLRPAADLYACGVTLWEMLSGRPPFRGVSDMETFQRHLEAPLPRPASALRGAPANLQSLAVDLLQKEPRHRPGSAVEALRRLDRHSWLGTRVRTIWRAKARALAAKRRAAVAALAVASVPGIVIPTTFYLMTPTSVHLEENHLVWQTRAGIRWEGAPWTQELTSAFLLHAPRRLFPTTIVAAKSYDSARGRILREDGSLAPAIYRIDRFGLRTAPFWEGPTRERDLMRQPPYPFTGDTYVVEQAFPLGRASPDSEAAFGLIMNNNAVYPTRIATINGVGAIGMVYEHPGRFYSPVPVPGRGDRPALILLGAMNNLLGPRNAVLALRSEETEPGQAPPYTGGAKVRDTCQWYLPLPYYLRQEVDVIVEGDRGVAILGGGARVAFDLDRGFPLDAVARGGLTPDAWVDLRDGLMSALSRAAAHAESGAPGRGAEVLEEFGRRAAGPPWSVSIPYHRAAILRMQAALAPTDLVPALADIERAVAAEPEPPRYGLLHAEILARMGRTSEASVLLQAWWTRPAHEYYSFEWLLLRWLAGEDVPGEILTLAEERPTCGTWKLMIRLATSLRAKRPDTALSLLESQSNPATCWQSQWYLGARAAMWVSGPQSQDAGRFLDRAQQGLPTGYPVPVRLARLRSRLDADPRYLPASGDIDAALTELRQLVESARSDLEALYLLSFASDDAASIAARWGEPWTRSLEDVRALLAPVGERWRQPAVRE